MMMRYNGLDPCIYISSIYTVQYTDIYQHTSLKSKLTGVQSLDELTLPKERKINTELEEDKLGKSINTPL